METDKSDENRTFLHQVIKIEIEEEEGNENSDLQYNPADLGSDLVFSEAEITRDLESGQPVCMLCLEVLPPNAVIDHMVTVHKYRKIRLKCWNCEEVFEERSHLTDHKQNCQPQKKVKKKQTIKQFMKEAEEKYSGNVCPICLLEVDGPLPQHLRSEHQVGAAQEAGAFACPICEKVFRHRSTLYQHKRFAHGSERNSVQCSQCDKRFASSVLLNNHVRNVHPTDGAVHRCDECAKVYKSHQSLYQHIKYVHLKAKPKKKKAQEQETDGSSG